MFKIIYQPNNYLCTLLIAFACFVFTGLAQANDDDALKKGFLNLTGFAIEDTANSHWRVVAATDEMQALGAKPFLLEGKSNDNGEILFSQQQRQALYTAWNKTPNQLWLVYISRTYQLTPVKTAKGYQFDLVQPESIVARKMREESEIAELASKTPLKASVYTQAGFDAKPFAKDYASWQQRFKQDAETFNAKMRKDREYGRKIVADENPDALKQAFANSIDSGKKGLSLRGELIASYYAGRPTEGTEVTPPGMVFSQLVLDKNAKPVGYGGTFIDENTTVELWYMVFDDMTDWKLSDFNDSLVFGAFAREIAPAADAAATPAGEAEPARKYQSAELPPYKTIKRNSWPALVFTREPDGKIKLYGMSMEIAQILGNIWNKQLF